MCAVVGRLSDLAPQWALAGSSSSASASGLAVSLYSTANHCEWEMHLYSKRSWQWDINGHGVGGVVQTSLGIGLRLWLTGCGTLLLLCYCFSRTLGLQSVQLSRETAVNYIEFHSQGLSQQPFLRSLLVLLWDCCIFTSIQAPVRQVLSIDSRIVSDI